MRGILGPVVVLICAAMKGGRKRKSEQIFVPAVVRICVATKGKRKWKKG